MTIQGLGKLYRLGQLRTAQGSVRDAWERMWSKHGHSPASDFWALRDVSFDVAQGEVVGLIGRNGAGKSTLLKILSRITPPTEGIVTIRGSVGSLLEVGAGFHPELTGRENIFMNGAILGMRSSEIRSKFDEIVTFAEVEQFLDTPVKRYSSGMYVRLAFAVAAHLEPEVLIVDEVLAVGDAAFQRKCLNKMGDVSRGGRTVLFVSHNMTAVQSLCSRAVLIEQGHVVADGTPGEVIHQYMGGATALTGERTWEPDSAPRSPLVVLRAARIRSGSAGVTGSVSCIDEFSVEFDYEIKHSGSRIGTTLIVRNSDGVTVFTSLSSADPNWRSVGRSTGSYRSTCTIPADLLAEDLYAISVVFWSDNYQLTLSEPDVLRVSVEGPCRARADYMWQFDGVVAPLLRWSAVESGLNSPLTSEDGRST